MHRRFFLVGTGMSLAGLFLPGDSSYIPGQKQPIISTTASIDDKPTDNKLTDHNEQSSQLERLLEVTYPEDIHQFTIPKSKDPHLGDVLAAFEKHIYPYYDTLIELYRARKLVSHDQVQPMQEAFLTAINKSVEDAIKASPYLSEFFNRNYQRLEQNALMVLDEYFKEHDISFITKISRLRSGFPISDLSLVRVYKEVPGIRIASRDFGSATTTISLNHREVKGFDYYERETTAHAEGASVEIDISNLQHELSILYRILSGSVQPQTPDEELSISTLHRDLGHFHNQAHSEQEFVDLALPLYVKSFLYHEAGHIVYEAYLTKHGLSKKGSKDRNERDQGHQLQEIVGLYLSAIEGGLPNMGLTQIGSIHVKFPYDYAGDKLFATMPQSVGLPLARTQPPLTDKEKVEILQQLSSLPRERIVTGLRQVYEQCLPELKAGRKI